MKYVKIISLFVLLFLFGRTDVRSQHWKKVFTVPSIGSSAHFFNPDVGCIGTGSYPEGYAAQIYYTTDGGKSWARSLMPNMNMLGQITDIYYADRYNGWATLREAIEHGWSGVYKTTDGGRSWILRYQAEFPVSVRQTKRGVFFTDRYRGVRFSNDDGYTFQTVADYSGALGLDFLDENIGFSTSEGNFSAQPFITLNGGFTWSPYNTLHEAWTAFADVSTGQFFAASERNSRFPSTESMILGSVDNGTNFSARWAGTGDAISGGIAGTRWCRSVIYVQGQDSSSKNPGVIGMMRSLDGGNNWIKVGGPSNYNDKRFAVTGKGAVVYAFDKAGGVWKTSDGGDGMLTASAFPTLTLTKLNTTSPLTARLCDSSDFSVQLKYSDCDSLIISNVAFIDDNIGELSIPKKARFFGKDNLVFDTLLLRFKPRQVHIATERVRVTFRQPDGFTQDTLIFLQIQGLPSPDLPVIQEATPGNQLEFGTHSVCGDDSVRVVTITNRGCAAMTVKSLVTSGAPFMLLSSFAPFVLDPGTSRTYLVQFKPTVVGSSAGTLILSTTSSSDTIRLSGVGSGGLHGYKLSQPNITSTICDSTEGDVIFKNVSCTPIRLDSIRIDAPFRIDKIATPIIINVDASITLHYHFAPRVDGSISRSVTIHSININDTGHHFEDILLIEALATRGLPGIALSTNLLDFGSINTCSYRELEVTITNNGCDTLKISKENFVGVATGFGITQSSNGLSIARGSTTKIIIRFKPPNAGSFSTILHLETNAGSKDITLTAIGSNDPGSLTLIASGIGEVLTCRDSGFVMLLTNTTCDSLTLDSVLFVGVGASDYQINPIVSVPMPSGKVLVIAGRFIPQAGGPRNVVAHFYLHLIDGTFKEINVPLDGAGLAPVVIQLSLPSVNLTAQAGVQTSLPIQLLDPSIVDVSKVVVGLKFNTDLLDPEGFDMAGSVLNGALVSPLVKTKSSVSITVQLPTPQRLSIGLFGTLKLRPYISDSLTTAIVLTDFTAYDALNTLLCLPTAIVVPPQIVTSFSLSTQCGDGSISEYMRNGISSLMIAHITPNPTHSSIAIQIKIPPGYANDGRIEIFDALGVCTQTEPLVVGKGERFAIRNIELQGPSGLRVIRVRSTEGTSSQNLYLLR